MNGLVAVLLVGSGAAVGAPVRYWLASRLDDTSAADAGRWPRGTLAVNLLGSLVLGVVVGAALDHAWALALGTGFCGGLTTYSSLAVQSVVVGDRRLRAGIGYLTLTTLAGLGLCALGYLLGRALA